MDGDRKSVRAPVVKRRPAIAARAPVAAVGRVSAAGAGLQQRLGNLGTHALAAQVVARFCAECTSTSAASTGQLSVSQPGDASEREAERVADVVMRVPAPDATTSNSSRLTGASAGAVVQRRCAECEEASKEPNLQRREAAAGTPQITPSVAAGISALRGGGSPLPASIREFFEPRFGADFTQVRLHTDTRAADTAKSISAKAFTFGRDIAFSVGQYAPESHEGQRLLAHELAHVVQQRGAEIQRAPQNFLITPASPGKVIQRKGKKSHFVPYEIHVKQPMTAEQFKDVATRQIFGAVRKDVEWRNLKGSYDPQNGPYAVQVDVLLLRQQRATASRERGIDVGDEGGVIGGKERAKTFHAGPASDQKASLMQAIDRRYFEAIGDKTETKITAGEQGKAELWRMIRDEVLFEHEYLANLPPHVQRVIKASIHGRDLTPADYDKVFGIARKIAQMPAAQVADYSSKVAAETLGLDALDKAIEEYFAAAAKQDKQNAERDTIHTKLVGLEKLYEKYRTWKTLSMADAMSSGIVFTGAPVMVPSGPTMTIEAIRLMNELDAELKPHGFAGLDGFVAWINRYEQAFESGAASIAQDLLAKFAGKLYQQSERYQDPNELDALHQQLGGMRANYQEVVKSVQIINQHAGDRQRRQMPGSWDYSIRPAEQAARKRIEAARESARSQFKDLARNHPLFEEEGLPEDRRIDKGALASADRNQLGALLQAQIARRMGDVNEAREQIEGKPELIYKMDKLMPQFYARLGVVPGSIHDMIIRDKLRSDLILKIVKGIAFAIVAIALSVVTFGAATPAIVAVGAGIAGAALGAYQAYESYQEYTQEKNLADVGFAKDPSVVWLVIAIAGAALDMGAAVNAVSKLGKAAQALDAGGDLKAFMEVVKRVEQEQEITAAVARAAEKAAVARKGLAEASADLTRALLGKAYGFPGPLLDPEVYAAVVRMARQAIRTKVYDAQKFIEELRLARVKAGLADLAPEELAKAKEAWELAKTLEAADAVRYQNLLKQIPDAAKLNALISQAGDVEKLERLLKLFPSGELETIFAKLKDTGRLATMLEHIEPEGAAAMIRQWISKGKIDDLNQFMERLASGVGKELAEKSALTANSLIIDSNTAIALAMDADPALRGAMHAGHKARVAYIKSLPPGTELRMGNITVGEVGSGAVTVKGLPDLKGLPLEVARESAEYRKVFQALESEKVGTGKGFADRALLADAFFAKTEPGVIPKLISADQQAVKKLAGLAKPPIKVDRVIGSTGKSGWPGLVEEYGKTGKGFNVEIESRTLTVIPVD